MKRLCITMDWLEEQGACAKGKAWFERSGLKSLSGVINRLVKEKQFEWANWTLVRFMSHTQQVRYACFAARLSLPLYEKVYPEDDRPRKAIEAAEAWVANPTEENRSAARSAARSAESAAWSAACSAAFTKILRQGLKILSKKD